MQTIIAILSIFGLIFILKETDGPWNLISRWRNWMMRLPWIGVQFFNLLNCYACSGFWGGVAIYFLTQESYKLNWAICWGLSGTTVCLTIDAVLSRLYRQ